MKLQEAKAYIKEGNCKEIFSRIYGDGAEVQKARYLQALEAFTAAADGKATKIIIPSELQGLAGLAGAAKSVFDTEEPKA